MTNPYEAVTTIAAVTGASIVACRFFEWHYKCKISSVPSDEQHERTLHAYVKGYRDGTATPVSPVPDPAPEELAIEPVAPQPADGTPYTNSEATNVTTLYIQPTPKMVPVIMQVADPVTPAPVTNQVSP